MKRGILLILVIFTAACTGNKFAELDSILDRHEEIDERVRHKTDSLLARFKSASTDSLRFECAEDLYDEWKHLNLDTCIRYTELMMRYSGNDSSRILRSNAARVRNLVRQEHIDQAESLFLSINLPPDASEEDRYSYFYSANRLFNGLNMGKDPRLPAIINSLSDELKRDSTAFRAHLFKIKAWRFEGKRDSALAYALAYPIDSIKDPYELSSMYNGIASLYYETHQLDKAIEYCIKGACVDLETGMNDYYTLFFLARMLFQTGDKDRAARYMNRAVQDALDYNYPVGIRRSARASTMMNDAIHEISRNRRIILVTGITLVSVLLAISLLLLFISRKNLGRVRSMNRKYAQSQSALHNVSLIKDRMLGEYMELSSNYIYKVDESKSRYRKVLKENGAEALQVLFREPNFADSEYPNYWNNFDKIFLSIFPDFVEGVNALMLPGHEFVPEGPQGLNTELRILALIRLGITESKRISSILHISKGTVYTYRSIMRQNSTFPDDFEKKVGSLETL